MRFVLVLLSICFWSFDLSAQIDKDSVYISVDVKPIFPGCELARSVADINDCTTRDLFTWVFQNMEYPPSAREGGRFGTVVVSFVINTDGTMVDPQVIKTPNASLGDVSIQVITRMQKEITWIPARREGRPVRYKYVLPIKFKLDPPDVGDMYLVFKAWGGIEVFRGMVPSTVHEKIPGDFIKNIETLDFQKSKDYYNVVGNAHIVNFKRNNLALPQELRSHKPKDVSALALSDLKVRYSSSNGLLNLSSGQIDQPTSYYIHNYIGDIIHKGQLQPSKPTLEQIDVRKTPDAVLFVSFVQDDIFATVLVSEE